MFDKSIGFIGAGQMAQALATGFCRSGLIPGKRIYFHDPSEAAGLQFQARVADANRCSSNDDLIDSAEVVVLAVKPQQMGAISLVKQADQVSTKLIVSVVAGLHLKRLTEMLRTNRLIRVMPNTPALVGAGAAGYCRGDGASVEDGQLVSQLLATVGYAVEVREDLLDAVTGLSGSGPAYVFQFIEALADGGVLAGLPRDVASRLAAQTVFGAAKLLLESNEHPAVLKDRVASPGGTTMSGLHALESGGFRASIISAVCAATRRAQELGSE